MQNFNALQLHMLLLDSIVHYTSGMHTTRNYITAKRMFCSAMGLSSRTTSKKMIEAIGYVYIENGMEEKFRKTCERFDLQVN
jgi:hypothetical protein